LFDLALAKRDEGDFSSHKKSAQNDEGKDEAYSVIDMTTGVSFHDVRSLASVLPISATPG
jgi:hypothetical protein